MAEAEWFNNSNVWFGGVVGAAIAIPAGIALAPPVIAGLGVIGGAAALTALGAGVIAITSVIGKHIDEAIEAHNSHETIKKILDSTEVGYTDAKKIEDIERIVKAKTNNIFLKLFDHQSSQEIDDLYLGALDRKLPNISEEEYEDEKIIAGLKVVNKLDQLKSTNDEEFIRKLNEFKEKINLKSTYQVGQKITEQSEKFSYGVADVKSFFDTLAEGLVGGAAAAAAAAAADPAAVAAARAAKIRQDFEKHATNTKSGFSTIYQYKVSMGLDILSDTSKSEATKID